MRTRTILKTAGALALAGFLAACAGNELPLNTTPVGHWVIPADSSGVAMKFVPGDPIVTGEIDPITLLQF